VVPERRVHRWRPLQASQHVLRQQGDGEDLRENLENMGYISTTSCGYIYTHPVGSRALGVGCAVGTVREPAAAAAARQETTATKQRHSDRSSPHGFCMQRQVIPCGPFSARDTTFCVGLLVRLLYAAPSHPSTFCVGLLQWKVRSTSGSAASTILALTGVDSVTEEYRARLEEMTNATQ
jgi:hypothetical protein